MKELNISNLNNKLQDPGHNGYVTFHEWKVYEFRRTKKGDETWAPTFNMLFKTTKETKQGLIHDEEEEDYDDDEDDEKCS
jgi:hypothetical protein